MYKTRQGAGLKILTPKQMLQRLPIALAQVKSDNNLESLLIEIRQTVYSLYQSKEINKKLQSNIIKSMQIQKNGYYIYELRNMESWNDEFNEFINIER